MAPLDRNQLTVIGRVTAPHGVLGDIKVAPQTEDPAYYQTLKEVYLDSPKGLKGFKVKAFVWKGAWWLARLEGLDDRTAAGDLKGAMVLVQDSQLKPLAEDEYFIHDLMGCRVESPQGENLGQVTELMETGADPVLVVRRGDLMDTEWLLPLAAAYVQSVDAAAKIIHADPPVELLELNLPDPSAEKTGLRQKESPGLKAKREARPKGQK
ncbi:MAG: ribosome maturation factor RimM [Deltaproteobacteria bacterium]|nr:ribosome maturation factor RimM [Deltaproteobacteria bacterium]